MPPVAVLGNLARDLVDGGRPRVGGGPFYAAWALRELGTPARILTKCSDADRDALMSPVLALGVPVDVGRASAMPSFAIEYDGERRRMRVEVVGDVWTRDEVVGWVDEALEDARWVHVAPLARTDFPAATLAALADGGRLVSYDGQGLVRPGRVGELRLDAEYDPDVLRHLHVLKLAEEEAAVVLDRIDQASVAALGVPEVLVTLGPRGSLVFAGGPPERVQAIAVEADPTGAGDMFMAAYVAARNEGTAPGDAARRASRLVEQLLSMRVSEA